MYGVGWFPTVMIIRLSLPPAGDWLAGDWVELGKILYFESFEKNTHFGRAVHTLDGKPGRKQLTL